MIVQFSTYFMDKHAIDLCFSRVEVDFSIECSSSESMFSIFNSLQAKARKYPFSTVNRASVLAFISFLGLLAVGKTIYQVFVPYNLKGKKGNSNYTYC